MGGIKVSWWEKTEKIKNRSGEAYQRPESTLQNLTPD